jgi:hypothetical protein
MKKPIATINVITDTDNLIKNISDITFEPFDEKWLKCFIKKYGTERLLEILVSLQWQIIKTKNEINEENHSGKHLMNCPTCCGTGLLPSISFEESEIKIPCTLCNGSGKITE